MRKTFFCAIIAFLLYPLQDIVAQTYQQLWKQVTEAQQKDLPQTELKTLQQIVEKAERENAYGHLLKAELMKARVHSEISTDSLAPAVARLSQKAEATKDIPLQAVYYAVLGKIYASNSSALDDAKVLSAECFRKAMANPARLAAVKADDYEPLVKKGAYSRYYGDDLLSLIAHETSQFVALHDYYLITNNRPAQLMSAIYALDEPDGYDDYLQSRSIRRLDSLTAVYGDLQECGELAVTRYQYMCDQTNATPQEKVAYIDEALSRWGGWPRMNILRNARKNLTNGQFDALLEHSVWIPNREQTLRLVNLRGISDIEIKIYKVKADGNTTLHPENKSDFQKLKPLLTPMPEATLKRHFSSHPDYELFEDSLTLGALPVGVYMMEVTTQPQTIVSRTLFFVSDVRVVVQSLPDHAVRLVAVNATTGQPLPAATFQLLKRSGTQNTVEATLTADRKGEYVYKYQHNQRPRCVYATYKDDRACPELWVYDNYSYYDHERTTHQAAIYTDRAIYRPGQTVNVSAILYTAKNGFEHEVEAGKTVTAVLRDANYKVVAEQQLQTDDFGTVSTQFTLPTTALSGEFSVQIDGKSKFFRVEEYKRPSFQVEFPQVDENYQEGDTLRLKASARSYAGVPVQGARVSYKVERRRAFWWASFSRYYQSAFVGDGSRSEVVYSAETTTADDGTFDVQVPLLMPKNKYPQFYHFVVVADVTDQAGESHEGQLSLPLGNRKTAIAVDLPEKMLAEQMPPIKAHLFNAAGHDVQAQFRYQVDGGKWQEVASNTPFSLSSLKLKSGKHVMSFTYEEDTVRREFVVFSLTDKCPAVDTDDWFYVSAQQFPTDGSPVTLQAGGSRPLHILYSLMAGNKLLEQGAIDKRGELVNRKLTYQPEYGNGLTISYVWTIDGETYTHSEQIQRPLPDKKLKMKWETFRNRLTPGQQEEWTLSILTPDGKAAQAQLLATLYDKSLDQIVNHQWSLNPYVSLPVPSAPWLTGEWGFATCYGYQSFTNLKEEDLVFNYFDTDCFPYYWLSRRYQLVTSPRKEMAYGAQRATLNTSMAVEESADEFAGKAMAKVADVSIGAFDVAENAKQSDEAPEVQIRENLQETAFFYPQLLVDSLGRVSLKFTLPESLTTWRFMGVAHTKDMMHGYLDGESIAQKDVMIQPNMPRFLRVGDEATLSALLFNMKENEIQGTARLELIDPESGATLFSDQQPCVVAAGASSSVKFNIDCTSLDDYSLLICKMTMTGETFSDGEQHYLPVLSDQERVTVTIPFTQNELGTKAIPLSAYSKYPDAKITVEYTNNPAWLMIQALPTLAHPHDNCAVCKAAAYYSNAIGKHLLDQNPQAKHVFEMWKQDGSLGSALQKNEELKDLLLTETPWVMDAEREADQKQRLADFFDNNLLHQRQEQAVAQLQKLQRADGAWSWWEGMAGSFYMTVEVSNMLVRLNQKVGLQPATRQMLDKAFGFMDKEIVALVAEMKKQEKKGIRQSFPTYKALQYLYIYAIDGRKPSAQAAEAQNYLKKLLQKEGRNLTIYEKAMACIILKSGLFLKSLNEWSTYKEGVGRYYDTPRATYSWRDYRIPTQVAVIEAMKQLMPGDHKTISQFQQWLLHEKRTQAWDTPLNSIDAVYAFLDGNSQALVSQPQTVLKVDGQPLETSQATAGLGYVKTTLATPQPQELMAEKTSSGTSWGAVYAQFMQKTAEITDQKNGISIKRELLNANPDHLTVGQRVRVRLTIQADRDYDFVEVVDRRAACMEPVQQLSGYRNGAYCVVNDCSTNYYFDILSKGKHVVETEYYIDRAGRYETGTSSVQCAYAPEFRATTHSLTICANEQEKK